MRPNLLIIFHIFFIRSWYNIFYISSHHITMSIFLLFLQLFLFLNLTAFFFSFFSEMKLEIFSLLNSFFCDFTTFNLNIYIFFYFSFFFFMMMIKKKFHFFIFISRSWYKNNIFSNTFILKLAHWSSFGVSQCKLSKFFCIVA